jgi:ABC-type dipeptide/oligopeptide/nickel transport system permease subunit
MKRAPVRIAQLYEALPYLYIAAGLAAVGASFIWRVAEWSDVLALTGVVAIIGGLVLALRRRDYRIQKRSYGSELDDEE